MTPNPLDEIQARVDRVPAKGDSAFVGLGLPLQSTTELWNLRHIAREDVPKLVAALRAVEAVHVMSCELSVSNCDKGESCPLACCGPCGETWPCPTITAIREALA